MKTREKRTGGRLVECDVSEFDREFVADTFSTPPPQARARWLRAKRKRGRPRIGRGAEVISVSVERELLAHADRLAARLHIPRAALIASGLRAALALYGAAPAEAARSVLARRSRKTA